MCRFITSLVRRLCFRYRWFVCLSVSNITQYHEWIVMKFYGWVWDGKWYVITFL